MTVLEFHNNFNIELDKTLDFELPYMLPEQIDYWLNKGQERFVKSRAFGNNYFKTGFEQSEKRMDDLREILVQSTPITPSSSSNIFSSNLPDDYMFLMRHQCHSLCSDCDTPMLVPGIQTTQDEMNILLRDPFWSPIAYDPLFYIMGNSIVYETDGSFSIVDTILIYLRKYNKIQLGSQYVDPTDDVDCELAEHTHQEILDMSIEMVLENLESQRYQTNLNEQTKIE